MFTRFRVSCRGFLVFVSLKFPGPNALYHTTILLGLKKPDIFLEEICDFIGEKVSYQGLQWGSNPGSPGVRPAR